jgi:hypothetical protein
MFQEFYDGFFNTLIVYDPSTISASSTEEPSQEYPWSLDFTYTLLLKRQDNQGVVWPEEVVLCAIGYLVGLFVGGTTLGRGILEMMAIWKPASVKLLRRYIKPDKTSVIIAAHLQEVAAGLFLEGDRRERPLASLLGDDFFALERLRGSVTEGLRSTLGYEGLVEASSLADYPETLEQGRIRLEDGKLPQAQKEAERRKDEFVNRCQQELQSGVQNCLSPTLPSRVNGLLEELHLVKASLVKAKASIRGEQEHTQQRIETWKSEFALHHTGVTRLIQLMPPLSILVLLMLTVPLSLAVFVALLGGILAWSAATVMASVVAVLETLLGATWLIYRWWEEVHSHREAALDALTNLSDALAQLVAHEALTKLVADLTTLVDNHGKTTEGLVEALTKAHSETVEQVAGLQAIMTNREQESEKANLADHLLPLSTVISKYHSSLEQRAKAAISMIPPDEWLGMIPSVCPDSIKRLLTQPCQEESKDFMSTFSAYQLYTQEDLDRDLRIGSVWFTHPRRSDNVTFISAAQIPGAEAPGLSFLPEQDGRQMFLVFLDQVAY